MHSTDLYIEVINSVKNKDGLDLKRKKEELNFSSQTMIITTF